LGDSRHRRWRDDQPTVGNRCFAGLSVEETAEALGASDGTVKRDWAFARAWLNREPDPESS
jgi:DNA-directed RNA polymerase specialized sigma24 family protein